MVLATFANATLSIASEISWTRDYDSGMEQASRELKPVLLDFRASWCEPDRKIPGEAVRPHRGFGPRFFFGLFSIFAVAQDAHALRYAAMKLESAGYFAVRGRCQAIRAGGTARSTCSAWIPTATRCSAAIPTAGGTAALLPS